MELSIMSNQSISPVYYTSEVNLGLKGRNFPNAFELTDDVVAEIKMRQADKSLIKLDLFDHQLRSLSYAQHLEKASFIEIPTLKIKVMTDCALYCDPASSGKSLVMLSLIASLPNLEKKKMNPVNPFNYGVPHSNIGVIKYTSDDVLSKPIEPVSVIVCPTHLFEQWKDYIRSQTTLSFEYISKKDDFVGFDISVIDGILVTATQYNELASILYSKQIIVSRVIYDEVHCLKIPKSSPMDAAFYWFISASPDEVEGFVKYKKGFIANKLKELCSFQHVERKSCGLIFRNQDSLINKRIKLPALKSNIISVRAVQVINILNGVVDNEVLGLIAADDIDAAMKKVGVTTTSSDNIIELVCNDLVKQKKMEEHAISELESKEWKNENAQLKCIEGHRDKIKEIEKKMEMIKKRITEEKMDPITYDPIETPAVTPCCKNTFDYKTITEYLIRDNTGKKCPMCRQPLDHRKLIVIKEGKNEVVGVKPKKTQIFESKQDALDNLLYSIRKHNKNAKIIISSGQVKNFADVHEAFTKNKLSLRKMEGNIQSRNKTLREFKEGDLNGIYLPAYDAGSGLHLINATDLIIMHKLSEGFRDQVIHRAHRLGRTTSLNLYEILYENEINI